MDSIYETMHGNRGNKEGEEESGMSHTNRHSPALVEVNKLKYVSMFTEWSLQARATNTQQEEDVYV